jgi:tetratricopeptide (TPR) repeat protein
VSIKRNVLIVNKSVRQPDFVSKRGFFSRRILVATLAVLILCLAAHLTRQGWGTYHYHAAERALARREFSSAQEHLNRCLGVWPTNPETLLTAAQAARRGGQPGAALRLLDAAERAQAVPEAVAFERELAFIQTGRSNQTDYYLQICADHPETAQARLIAEATIVGSLETLDLVRVRRGLELWDTRSSNEADRIQAVIWRGELAIRTGDVDTAIAHFRQGVEADPDNDASRLRLAELLSRPAPQEALVHLQLLHEKRPADRDVRLQLARCYRALGEHEAATRLLSALSDQYPEDIAVLIEQGLVAVDLQRADEAERWLRRAESLQPQRREVSLALARCLQLAGKVQEAQQYRDKVAKLDAAWEKRAKSMLEKGRLEP